MNYMKKFYACYIIFIALLLSGSVMGQQVLMDAIKAKKLNDASVTLKSAYLANQKKAFDVAIKKGWITYKKRADGSIISLQGIDSLGFPIYLISSNNIIAAGTTRTNTVQPGGKLNLNLSGSSKVMNDKMAIWDGGIVYAAHQEFAGKAISFPDGSTNIVEHSTHVAGTLTAKGVYAPAKGMSFGANTLLSYDFNNDESEMTAAAPNLLLSNHSYGYTAGWIYDGDNAIWDWYGLPGDSVDYKFGYYDTHSQKYDQIAYSAPKYLIVAAAGNSRGYNGPAVGTSYNGYTSRTNGTIINKGPRVAGISSQIYYDNLTSPAIGKNVLSVGAVNPLPNGPATAGSVQIAYFSSWGPTDDGRVKPDICGDGVNVLSTGITSTDAYIIESGTSMATPNVCGSLYLLQEYYSQKNSGIFMLAATLKGLACHTAFDAGNAGPDYIYGWGLLDMAKAAQAITDNGTYSLINEKTLPQGQTQTYNVVASGNGVLKATISWTDPAGTPGATGVINVRTPKLVNDLDIVVSDGTTTFNPWVLDPNNPAALATTGNNIVDNVEQVYIPNSVPGKSYTINVSHKGTLSSGSQNYSLIVTGIGGTAYCLSAPSSSADSRINNITLNDLNNTPSAGCTTYSNYTNLTATLEQGKTYPLNITLGTCGANFDKVAKVFIDWNNNGTFTDAGELIATSGVINGTGTYTTNITVPATVVAGNSSIMRVVLTETSDATTVSPCGTYGKGETQDYKVVFTASSIDAGITAINTPSTTGICPSNNSTVSVRIKNYGTTTLNNIPVTVTLTAAGGAVTTLSENYTGSLAPLAEDNFNLTGTFAALGGTSYTVTATTNVPNDAITANNSLTANAVINTSPVITNASAALCTDLNKYSLNATGDGQIFWYKNIGDALPFTYGSSVITAQPPINNTYYAGLNDFSGNVGPATKNTFSAGGYNQFTPAIYITTTAPVLIQSAKLYVGYPGTIVITVSTASGQTIATNTLNVAATRSVPAAGAQIDDPNDVGKVYNLNLAIPVAGKYILTVTFPDNATLYRNNGGVTGYPFSASGVLNITGNNATSPTSPADTTYNKNFYYYFYNMHVQSLGCASAARLAVVVGKPAITLTGINLNSNFAANNQWYYNGAIIAGATAATYTPLRSGIYRVDVATATGCISKSDNFSFVLPAKDNSDGSEISLALFPVPSNGQINLAFNAPQNGPLAVTVMNMLGQTVYKDSRVIPAGAYNTILNFIGLPTGSYIVRLTIGDKTYNRKIAIAR